MMNYEITESSDEALAAIAYPPFNSTKTVKQSKNGPLPHCQFPLDELLVGESFYVSKLAWLGGKSTKFVKTRGKATDKRFMVIVGEKQIEVARIG